LVVDRSGGLRGIVTRSDLLNVHARLDAVIRDEVMQRVLGRTLMIRPGAIRAEVDEGVVTISGRTTRRTTAVAAAQLTATVPGVTGVVDQLTFDLDDTVGATRPGRRPGPRTRVAVDASLPMPGKQRVHSSPSPAMVGGKEHRNA
ncbi:BON domain-containing protein, partial [Actinoplanes sp. NPDC048791]|uniref:BON domain-containing protein n=1 Tax=Actinoplanes sp. NPDC048791 TaxID=3154623 RepID=UPI00340BEF49